MPNCPHCEAELGSGDPAGLCPNCLIRALSTVRLAGRVENSNLDTAAAASPDDDYGRYLIVRTFGEGGMGTVYLAEQREPIRRRVALEVVKLGWIPTRCSRALPKSARRWR